MSARILVVDESRIVHQTVRLSLSDLAEITSVTSVEAAVEASGPWELAILSADFGEQLPGLVHGLRSASRELRLVVAVGVMKELDAEIEQRLGPVEVVKKPWVSRDFRALVERLLAETPEAYEPPPELEAPPALDGEASLPPPLTDASLEAITAPPEPVEGDSPFAAAVDDGGFDDMPSTQEFVDLVSQAPEAVDVEDDLPPVLDEEPPMGTLEAEAASIASDLEDGLSVLEASLGDLSELEEAQAGPVASTIPPQSARLNPPLVEQVAQMTAPPGGELGELGEPEPPAAEEAAYDSGPATIIDDADVMAALPIEDDGGSFEGGATGDVPPLEEDGEDHDSAPPEWPDLGTDDFADGLAVDEEPELLSAETNDSVIAALNALEDAAGMVEEAHGLDGEASVEASLEFDSVEPEAIAEKAAPAAPLTPEQWIALRAEMRDTAEALIRELVPELAEQIIRQEIQRLTEDFSADEPPPTP